MTAKWKMINPQYSVSDDGRVRNDVTSRVLKPVKMRNGYTTVCVTYKGKRAMHYIHRLVAEAFLTEDLERPHANHLDGCKTNNRLDNLEWCTPSENLRHAIATGLNKSTLTSVEKMNKATRKPVEQICLQTGQVIASFVSLSEARRSTGITSIHDCISGRQSTAGGFGWRYMKMRVNMGEAA